MRRVDVAGLHGDHITNELVRRVHSVLEEVHYDGIEPILQRGISPERLLLR